MNRDTASSAWGRDLSHISSCHCPAGRRQLSQVLHFSSSACHLHTKNHTWVCPKVPALRGNISQKKWFGQLSFHETRSVWNLQSKAPTFLKSPPHFGTFQRRPGRLSGPLRSLVVAGENQMLQRAQAAQAPLVPLAPQQQEAHASPSLKMCCLPSLATTGHHENRRIC